MSISVHLPRVAARVRSTLRAFFTLSISAALSACSLLPVGSNLTNQEMLTKMASAPSDTSVTLDASKKLLQGWRNEYDEAAQSRRRWELGFGEALFYGSVFAVLGAAVNRDHLRNVGIAVASGSSLLGGHYQVGAQKAAFRKAVKKLACMEEATMQITPADELLFPDISDATQKQALVDLPARLINRIGKVRTELGDTLNNIELTTPSKDEIGNIFKQWFAKKEATVASDLGPGERRGLADPAELRRLQLRKDRFIAALNKVNEEIEVCMTLSST